MEGDAHAVSPKTDASNLPVCYHPMPPTFYAELLQMFYAKLVIDITQLNGTFAWTCMQDRVGYVGIVFTEVHAELLYARLRDLIKTEMADAASKLFNREIREGLQGVGRRRQRRGQGRRWHRRQPWRPRQPWRWPRP